MWFLTNSSGVRIYLTVNKPVIFGRKKADIMLQNDESISRQHGTITVIPKKEVKANESISTCILKDLTSKYGTFVYINGEPQQIKDSGYNLEDQNKIRFGLQQHVFTVHYVPIVTAVSRLSTDEENKLQSIMNEIDGMITQDFQTECTHLTVADGLLTEKVCCAMACARPIITMEYWEVVKNAVATGASMPNPELYVPSLKEEDIHHGEVSLAQNENRKTLFKNLIFVHFDAKQYKKYGRMIHMTGGKSILYGQKPLSEKDLCARNVVILDYPHTDSLSETCNDTFAEEFSKTSNILEKNNRRVIPPLDIPLAILHCSVKQYCNPKFRYQSLLKRSEALCTSSKARVIVPDTQDLSQEVRILPKVVSNVSLNKSLTVRDKTGLLKIIPETNNSSELDTNLEKSVADSLQFGSQNLVVIPETEDSSFSESASQNRQKQQNQNKEVQVIANLDRSDNDQLVSKRSLQRTLGRKDGGCNSKSSNFVPETESFGDKRNSLCGSLRTLDKENFQIIPETCDNSDDNITTNVSRAKQGENKRAKEITCLSTSQERTSSILSDRSPKCTFGRKDVASTFKANNVIPETESFEDTDNSSSTTLNKDMELGAKVNVEIRKRHRSPDPQAKSPKVRILADSDDEIQELESVSKRKEFLRSELLPKNVSHKERPVNRESSVQQTAHDTVIQKQRKRQETTNIENAEEFTSVQTSSTNFSSFGNKSFERTVQRNNSTSSNLSKSTSFHRGVPGCKIFKKVYTNIPQKRITMTMMSKWDPFISKRCGDSNVSINMDSVKIELVNDNN